ncbi:MAG: AsmA family protein, partial [Gammaproteobacteria bacterium]|nr:AsmA family protein [Gammaproteobacteria bacterium]
MQLVGLQSTDVTVGIKAAGGKLRVNPSRASLYGGTYQGDISLDVTGAQPVLKLNERLQNVQFGPFSRDLLDASRLSGTLSGRITTTGSGATADAITASTSGNAEFAFKDGAYEGVDIWHRVRRARAVIKGGEAPAAPAEKRTRFADLTGTANIADGVLYTDDLSMVLPFMKVRGSGNLKLLSQELDFKFRGDIVDRPELTADVNDLVGVTIPLKVTGAVSQPDVNIDMGAVLAEVAKRKLGDKLGLGDGEPGQDAEDAIDQKKEELKDEIEDKLKDKLKDLFGGGG